MKGGGSAEGKAQRGKAVICFSAPLARRLATDQIRLPPTYVGVRRVRPSSRLVHKAMQSSSAVMIPSKTPVVFKVVDSTTGEERRMTSKEKKTLKLQRMQAQKEQKAALKLSSASTPVEESDSNAVGAVEDSKMKDEGRYVQLEVDASVLEQELADLRGERDGVPPVVLSQSMAAQAFQQGIITKDANTSTAVSDEMQMQTQPTPDVVVDDVLGGQWAEALKKSMVPAEVTRQREEMRPMPYQVVPETWVRMRPTLGESPSPVEVEADADAPPAPTDEKAWSFCQIRPTQPLDADLAAVVQLLHRGTNLHLSCGAKFGCDFLLYDGSRNERHAFAGLRVLHCDNSNNDASTSGLPLPTAYDMAGYVRCLNTAGKLSLLATVVKDDKTNTRRVALVDLALEKILQTSSRRSNKKTIADRKRTLAKTF